MNSIIGLVSSPYKLHIPTGSSGQNLTKLNMRCKIEIVISDLFKIDFKYQSRGEIKYKVSHETSDSQKSVLPKGRNFKL